MVVVSASSRPFAPTLPSARTKKWLRQRSPPLLHLKKTKNPPSSSSILVMLIWNQEWQKVLIRLNLFPQEVRQSLELHQIHELPVLQVYPLHLICALDPPPIVVHLCCRLFPEGFPSIDSHW